MNRREIDIYLIEVAWIIDDRYHPYDFHPHHNLMLPIRTKETNRRSSEKQDSFF